MEQNIRKTSILKVDTIIREDAPPDEIPIGREPKTNGSRVCASYPVWASQRGELSPTLIDFLEKNFVGKSGITNNSVTTFIAPNSTVSDIYDFLHKELASLNMSDSEIDSRLWLLQQDKDVCIYVTKY
jgi:hypothetical protein